MKTGHAAEGVGALRLYQGDNSARGAVAHCSPAQHL